MKKLMTILCLAAIFTSTANAQTEDELGQIIEKGVTWLINQQEGNGHFRYEYMPFLDRYVTDDNIVRQAGALYVLGEVGTRNVLKDFDLKPNIESAISYFEANSVAGELDGQNFRCLLKKSDVCTLGGTSLALIGILDLLKMAPSLEEKYSALIEDYKNYILAMKVSEKGYRTHYYLKKNQSKSESPFGNGEAILALVRYYQYKQSTELEKLIEDSLDYFEKTYRAQWDNNYYLWGMAALKDWYKLFPEQKYYDFVKDYTDWRIAGQKDARDSTHNKCAYIEGVVSAYSVLENAATKNEKEFYLEEIDFWLEKSAFLQVEKVDRLRTRYKNGSWQTLRIKKASRAVGGFLTDENEPVQRIDFTQHCVSSYLQKLADL